MDLIPYCINLSKPANDLIMRGKFAIKNLPEAGINSIKDVARYLTFTLSKP
jgi:hypothetical protein